MFDGAARAGAIHGWLGAKKCQFSEKLLNLKRGRCQKDTSFLEQSPKLWVGTGWGVKSPKL